MAHKQTRMVTNKLPGEHPRSRISFRTARPFNVTLCCGLAVLFIAMPIVAQVRISVFLASNKGGLADGYRDTPDWIELENVGTGTVNLEGWHLTDDPDDLTKWTFPSRLLGAGEFLVVFASGRGAADPTGKLHTNFQLDAA